MREPSKLYFLLREAINVIVITYREIGIATYSLAAVNFFVKDDLVYQLSLYRKNVTPTPLKTEEDG